MKDDCLYKVKHTKKGMWFSNEILECNINDCPYGNLQRLTYEAGEQTIDICKTKGLIKKLDEQKTV